MGGRGCDVAATKGARRATGVAATSLAAARGYPWPVTKLACFGEESWRELEECLAKLAPKPARLAAARRGRTVRQTQRSVLQPLALLRDASLVGGGRSPSKPSSWALAAAMEAYLAAHADAPCKAIERKPRP